MDYEQFYATPPEVAKKLVGKVKRSSMILEPSAGTGALIEAYKDVHKIWSCDSFNPHCVEINPQRAAFLKDKKYKVLWDDFLTFNPLMPYKTIIMNPPFHEGAKHLLKALHLCAYDGEIVCILNAETIKSPFSNERKQLLRELDEQEKWEYEIIENAFSDAERPTDVEIAMIYVKKKAFDGESIILNKFKKFVVAEREQEQEKSLMRYGEIASLVDTHDAEVMAALSLYDEIQNYNRVALKEANYDDGVFEIKIDGDSSRYMENPHAAIVQKINPKYWKRLFTLNDISHLMTSAIRSQYYSKINEMAVFDTFTHKYSYEENSPNIYYYNGWKTNKAFYCNKKVIIPLRMFNYHSAFTSPFNGKKYPASWEFNEMNGELDDIELAMNYLDSGHTDFPKDMSQKLSFAHAQEYYRNIDTKFFIITLYKKGTAHLVFKDMELLKKFNIYAGRKKNWLPPSYGQKHYEEMDDEEKAVIDSFEGKKSYEETMYKRDFYLSSPVEHVLMLASGEQGGRINERQC